jgi:iron complex outermembrane receptor protein
LKEETQTENVGLDFGFKNRINGTVDLYRRTTKDLLLYTQNPSSSDSQIMTIIILEQ